MAEIKDYLSVRQFAERLGITTQAVRKAIAAKRIKADRMGDYYVLHKEQLKKMRIKNI